MNNNLPILQVINVLSTHTKKKKTKKKIPNVTIYLANLKKKWTIGRHIIYEKKKENIYRKMMMTTTTIRENNSISNKFTSMKQNTFFFFYYLMLLSHVHELFHEEVNYSYTPSPSLHFSSDDVYFTDTMHDWC